MPLFVYRCLNGHETEALEPPGAPRKRDCPECGGESWRVMAVASVPRDGRYSYAPAEKAET